jgi:superfamily II DNA helicase RecQ
MNLDPIIYQLHPSAPIIAMTSTANTKAIKEISLNLNIKSFVLLKSSINRFFDFFF